MSDLVIAYVMDEDERQLAHDRLEDPEDRGATVLGHADAATVIELRDQGVLVDEVDVASDREQSRRRGATTAGADSELAPPPSAGPLPDDVPGSFDIGLTGPLTDDQHDAIEATGARFAERLGSYTWAVLATNAQAGELTSLAFVAEVSRPGSQEPAADAGAAEGLAGGGPAGPPAEPALFDLLLDGTRSADDVAADLAADPANGGFEVVLGSERRLRVRLPATSPVRADPRQVDGVEWGAPGNEAEPHLDRLRQLVGLPATPLAATGLDGKDQVVAIIDTGLDVTHPDFADRIHKTFVGGEEGEMTDPAGHGTHVAGIVLGDGHESDGLYRGVAPAARLVMFGSPAPQGNLGDLPMSVADRLAAARDAGATVVNNSWGTRSGRSEYTVDSYVVDEFVWQHPEMVVVFSAGNEAREEGSDLVTGNGWSITPPGTAKNVITVGASRSDRQSGGGAEKPWAVGFPRSVVTHSAVASQSVAGDPNGLAAFSGRGPAGRQVKPEVVAPGTAIISARSGTMPDPGSSALSGSTRYRYDSGTSMAAPAVSGLCALIRQWYVGQGVQPSAALVKATLVNGTRWLTGSDAQNGGQEPPNHDQGFGQVDLATTLPASDGTGLDLVFADTWQTPARCFSQNDTFATWRVEVRAGTPLRICLTYTDAPGRGVQNDLNMYVQGPGSAAKLLANSAVPQRNTQVMDKDNATEIIRVAEPVAGTWTIRVHCGALSVRPRTGQAYALVVTGALDGPLEFALG